MYEETGLIIKQGADWHITISLYGDKQQTLPFDLTGFEAKMQIRKEAGACNVIAEVTVSIPDPVIGKITGSLTAEQTQAIPTKGKSYEEMETYVCDLYIKKLATGARQRVLEKYVYVSPGVTRDD